MYRLKTYVGRDIISASRVFQIDSRYYVLIHEVKNNGVDIFEYVICVDIGLDNVMNNRGSVKRIDAIQKYEGGDE